MIPPAGLGPLSPSTATRVCAGAMQNACRRYGDLPPWGAPETAVLLPRICQPPHRAVLSGTRNRIRPVALLLHGDGLDGLEPLTSAFGSVLVTAGAALYRREKWLRYRP